MKHSITYTATLALTALTLLGGVARASDESLSLESALEIADQSHPSLVASQARARGSEAMSDSAPSLPPPTIFGSVMGSNGPFNSAGRMENSIGITQTIPFPTKLTSESKVRSLEADAARTSLEAERLKIRAEAKAAFYELYGARKAVDLLEDKKSIFEEHNKRVRATTLSDRIMQAHRIWIETELDLVENELVTAKEEVRIACGRLNVAMGRDPFLAVPPLQEPPLSELPTNPSNISAHPEIHSLELTKNAAEASISQAKSLWLPDLTVSYRNARRFDGLMPNYSEVTVGVTLPFLFFWETKGQVASANSKAEEAQATIRKEKNGLLMELFEAQTRAESLKEQLSNFDTKIIPQAERRMKIAHGLVPSDMESLNEHRDAMESVVKLKLAALKLRIDYEKSVARLERLAAGEKKK